MIKKLNWDSDFFEIAVGEITPEQYQATDDFSNFDLIYYKSNLASQIEINGFENSFSETKVVYAKEIIAKKNPILDSIFSIDDIKIDTNQLYQLAFESGKHSRFLLDSKFGTEKFKAMYQLWIDNSVSKTIADDVLIYVEKDKLLGFVSYKINGNFAQVGLIAVDANSQGKGIGGKILQYLEKRLLEKNINQLLIPTQLSNKQACSFYEKHCYKVHEQIAITHYWKI